MKKVLRLVRSRKMHFSSQGQLLASIRLVLGIFCHLCLLGMLSDFIGLCLSCRSNTNSSWHSVWLFVLNGRCVDVAIMESC